MAMEMAFIFNVGEKIIGQILQDFFFFFCKEWKSACRLKKTWHLCFKQKEKMTLGTSDTEISLLCHDKYQGDVIAK